MMAAPGVKAAKRKSGPSENNIRSIWGSAGNL